LNLGSISALVIFDVLAQSTKTSFFRAHRQFQLLVETMNSLHVSGTKKVENKRRYLG
jgi:hypothetical protein